MSLTMEERVERFETMRREGRLLRRAWSAADADGRERACWLVALAPETWEDGDPSECPAHVMPQWLAFLTPHVDDNGGDEAWPAMAERFGRCAARWHVLDADAWARVERTVLLEAVTIARETVTMDDMDDLPVLDEVMRLLCVGGSQQEWVAVVDAAYARGGGSAVRAAAAASDRADPCAATHAIYAAIDAVSETVGAASAAAWDRVSTALFDAIDREVNPPATLAQG